MPWLIDRIAARALCALNEVVNVWVVLRIAIRTRSPLNDVDMPWDTSLSKVQLRAAFEAIDTPMFTVRLKRLIISVSELKPKDSDWLKDLVRLQLRCTPDDKVKSLLTPRLVTQLR